MEAETLIFPYYSCSIPVTRIFLESLDDESSRLFFVMATRQTFIIQRMNEHLPTAHQRDMQSISRA